MHRMLHSCFKTRFLGATTGKCGKRYPQVFRETTTGDKDGYPTYARPNNGHSFKRGEEMFTNRHVVPYNPYLLSKFGCHINVEVSTSITSVKYLYKYVYRGHDHTVVDLSTLNTNGNPPPCDEVQEYVDARYILAPEAIWRIFAFDLQANFPPVHHLQLHLEDLKYVTFNIKEVEEFGTAPESTLTEFFVICMKVWANNAPEVIKIARTLTYSNFPEHFTWKKSPGGCSQRKNSQQSVGRVFWAGPASGLSCSLFFTLCINNLSSCLLFPRREILPSPPPVHCQRPYIKASPTFASTTTSSTLPSRLPPLPNGINV